jgi:hypothetical protein
MAIFRIVDCVPVGSAESCKYIVELRSGILNVGDQFTCWDTHHPLRYTIAEFHTEKSQVHLTCRGPFCYDGQFENALINTEFQERGVGFHFESEPS